MAFIEGSSFRGVEKYTYDFTRLGGAISELNMIGDPLPDNAIIYGGLLDVITVPVGVGASIGVDLNAADDIVASVAIAGAPWSTQGVKAIIPVCTAATAIKLTAYRTPQVSITAVPLTAGVFNVYLFYFLSD